MIQGKQYTYEAIKQVQKSQRGRGIAETYNVQNIVITHSIQVQACKAVSQTKDIYI